MDVLSVASARGDGGDFDPVASVEYCHAFFEVTGEYFHGLHSTELVNPLAIFFYLFRHYAVRLDNMLYSF